MYEGTASGRNGRRPSPPAKCLHSSGIKTIGLGILVAAGLATGCGGGDELPAVRAVVLPDRPPPTRQDVLNALANSATPEDDPHLSKEIEASVFALGNPKPNTAHPAWAAMVDALRAEAGAAERNGWFLLVRGCADSSGSETGFDNEQLAADRSTETRAEIAAAGVYPADRIGAEGLGVCGDEASDRRVTIRWVRSLSS